MSLWGKRWTGRDPKDIRIAAILFPSVIDSSINNNKAMNEKQPEHRQLLSGSIDEIGKDLQEIKKIGVDHAILNFNQSSLSRSNIDKIIDISKQLSGFMR